MCDNNFNERLELGGANSYSIKMLAWLAFRSDYRTLSEDNLKSLLIHNADNHFIKPMTRNEIAKWIKD